MADDLNSLLAANRSSSVLQGIANPAQVNPLAAVNSATQAARGIYDLRQAQAQEAAGQAFQNSIDPATGQPNQALLMQNLRDPRAAMAAQEAAQKGITLDTNTYDLHNKRTTSMMSGMSQLIADNPNGVPIEAAHALIDHRLQLGLITPQEAQAMKATMSANPIKNTQVILQGMASNLSAQLALQAAKPQPAVTDTGQVIQGTQTPAPLSSTGQPGAISPVGGSIAKSMQPGAGGTVDAVVQTPDGPVTVKIPYQSAFPGQVTPAARTGPTSAAPGVPPPPPSGTTARPAAGGAGTPAAAGTSSPVVQTPAGQGIVTSLPVGQQQATERTAEDYAKQATALTARADQVPTNKANYANMLGDLERIGNMPAGGEREVAVNTFLQKATGSGLTMTRDQVAAANSFSKLANIAVGQQLAAIGGTDARQALFMGSNPNLDLSKLGNTQIIHMLQGNEDAIQAKSRAWQEWVRSGNGPDTYGRFQDDFNHHFDPRVFQQRYMSSQEIQALRKSLTGPGETQKFLDDVKYARGRGWIQ
jgi:hypothetical protein